MPMPMDASGGDRKPCFYDPFYSRPGGIRLGAAADSDCSSRGWGWGYDDFSVFNHLHLPRPPSSPRVSSEMRVDSYRHGGVAVKPGSSSPELFLCRKPLKIEVESDAAQDSSSPKPSPRQVGKEALG